MRGKEVVYDAKQMRTAVESGKTLDQLNIRPGDEINVGQQKHVNFGTVVRAVGITAGLLSTILLISRR